MTRSVTRKSVPRTRPSHDEELIARAEAAVEKLSSQFGVWMEDECQRLAGLARALRGGADAGGFAALFRAAHDIKGEAATLGYPQLEAVAASLCRLIDHTPDKARIPPALIDRHIAAGFAAVRAPQAAATVAAVREAAAAAARFLAVAGDIASAPETESPPLAPE